MRLPKSPMLITVVGPSAGEFWRFQRAMNGSIAPSLSSSRGWLNLLKEPSG
jgi:hypothetical protein